MSFKEKKEAYLKMLDEDKELKSKMSAEILSMAEPRRMEIFLNPANEKELMFSETIITFYKDIIDLTNRVDTGEIKDIPIEENDGLKAIIKMFNAMLNNDTDVRLIDSSLSQEEQAKTVYELLVSLKDGDLLINEVNNSIGFNYLSIFDQMKVLKAWERFPDYLRVSAFTTTNKTIDEYIDTELNDLVIFTDTFHDYCENGKLDCKNI